MEVEWIAARAHLRHLMGKHPDWTISQFQRQIKQDIGYCFEWTRKWCHRLKDGDPHDFTILLSQSRRRKTPYDSISEEVEAKIIHYRDTLSKEYNRPVGPKNIRYQLQNDEHLRWLNVRIPTSTATITKVLHKYQRILRPAPRIHIPRTPAEPMQEWEIDYTDVSTAHSDATHKTRHQVESFHVVDAGTSIELTTVIGDDFHAETMISVFLDLFMTAGLPRTIRLDRDPRFVASWSIDKFPSAVMRFLLCLGIQLDICPPRRPDLKSYVERFIRSFKEECVYKHRPATVEQAQQVADNYSTFYNLERPNQAITCDNRPPAVALEHPPYLPRLPQTVDPDAWLAMYHNHTFRRKIRSNGSVTVDKYRYYVGKKYRGQRVLLRLDAETRQFVVFVEGKTVKHLAIKGLYNGAMELADYVELIQQEARSEARRLQRQRRIQLRNAA